MSGPKCYTPPPKYSMQVFDGKLNQIFQLQIRLRTMLTQLENLQTNDSALGIRFDCRDGLSRIRRQIEATLKLIVFDYQGVFGQETYNRIDAEIVARIGDLQARLHDCELVKTEFACKQNDYESFRAHLLFHCNSKISFDNFKDRILQYLKSNLAAKAPEMTKETENKIGKIKFEKQCAVFDFGFAKKLEAERQAIVNYLREKESDINEIKSEVSNAVFAKSYSTKQPENSVSTEAKGVIEAVKNLIQNCDDTNSRKKYQTELDNLVDSESLRNDYFFQELLSSTNEREYIRLVKIEMGKLMQDLDSYDFHHSTINEKQNFREICLKRMESAKVSKFEIENLRLKFAEIKKQSDTAVEEDAIRQKEHLFLKSQIINNLENMGYEVMDDLEVIDFEREKNFLLKIHDQDNYVNLKFREDGSMRYVFQIPEKRAELSTDQKNQKLHEMKMTCDEFQSVLADLAKMGLNVNLNSEQPINEEALISVPSYNRNKLKSKTRQTQKRQRLIKKYLGL